MPSKSRCSFYLPNFRSKLWNFADYARICTLPNDLENPVHHIIISPIIYCSCSRPWISDDGHDLVVEPGVIVDRLVLSSVSNAHIDVQDDTILCCLLTMTGLGVTFVNCRDIELYEQLLQRRSRTRVVYPKYPTDSQPRGQQISCSYTTDTMHLHAHITAVMDGRDGQTDKNHILTIWRNPQKPTENKTKEDQERKKLQTWIIHRVKAKSIILKRKTRTRTTRYGNKPKPKLEPSPETSADSRTSDVCGGGDDE